VTDDEFKAIFPGLADDPAFRVSSPFDLGYNCIAFAAGDTTRVWGADVVDGCHPGGYVLASGRCCA